MDIQGLLYTIVLLMAWLQATEQNLNKLKTGLKKGNLKPK